MKHEARETNMLNRRLNKVMEGRYLYVIFTYDSKQKRLVYTDTCSTLELAKKKLNKYAIERIPAVKAIRSLGSKYNAVYLLEHNGDVTPVYTLYRATEKINEIYKAEYKTKVRKGDKEVDSGYIGFAYNSKTDSYICTRLYDDSLNVKKHISKRYGVDRKSIEILDVIKIRRGFRFIDKKYADFTKLKEVKKALLDNQKLSTKELLQNELDSGNSKEIVEKILSNLTEEEMVNLLSKIKEEK